MRRQLWAICCCCLAMAGVPLANAVVDSEDGGVQILKQARENLSGQVQGYDYWARNNNGYPVNFQIQMQDHDNAINGLVQGEVVIPPGSVIYLGSVSRADVSQPWQFHYSWDGEAMQPGIVNP